MLRVDMFTEFVSVQLTREELQEIHAALVQRAIVEDEVREERGQEEIENRPLLEKLEMLLGESEERLHMQDHQLDDELWEYAWYAFTDEWAHFRARQDILKNFGADVQKADPVAFEKMIDTIYQKKFDAYVGELAMEEGKRKAAIRLPQDSRGSRSSLD